MSIINRLKKNALNLIITVTTILAIPAGFGTYALFESNFEPRMAGSG